jgi:hypothetical protein
MAGKLDEISRVIGQQEANVAALTKTFDQHCTDDDRRHEENLTTLRAISSELKTLNEAVTPLARTVAVMKPIVDSYQITRWKMAGAFAVVSMIMWAIGSLILTLAGKAIAWAFSVIFSR